MKHLMTQQHALKVSVEALSKVAPFAANNDVRYYLNGICVIPLASGGVLAIATNGHAILCARDICGHADRAVIVPITNKRNKSALKPRGTVRMTKDGAIFTETMNVVQFVVPEGEIEGKYPDLAKIFGRPDDYIRGVHEPIDLRYIKLIEGAAKLQDVVFWTRGDSGQGRLAMFTIKEDVFGGVMPLRAERLNPGITDIIPAELFEQPAETSTRTAEG